MMKKPERLNLEICDTSISIGPIDPELNSRLSCYFKEFLRPPESPDFHIRLEIFPVGHTELIGPVMSKALSHDGYSVKGGGFHLSLHHHCPFAIMQAMDDVKCVDRGIRALVAWLLSRNRGFLVHAAAVATSDGALLFPGISGAGKTTLAGMAKSAGFPVLNDEICGVRLLETGWTVYTTPFHGAYGPSECLAGIPLKCLMFPLHGSPKPPQYLSRADAVQKLLRCVIQYSPLNRDSQSLLDTLGILAETIPCADMVYSLNENPLLEPEAAHA